MIRNLLNYLTLKKKTAVFVLIKKGNKNKQNCFFLTDFFEILRDTLKYFKEREVYHLYLP